tara:strand:- start:1407 stop:1673 length:267 start_codon:yes stop_codon:yes gene_type:complete
LIRKFSAALTQTRPFNTATPNNAIKLTPAEILKGMSRNARAKNTHFSDETMNHLAEIRLNELNWRTQGLRTPPILTNQHLLLMKIFSV